MDLREIVQESPPYLLHAVSIFPFFPIHPALITIKVPQCLGEIYSPQEDLLECLKDDVRGRDPLEAVGSWLITSAVHGGYN